MPAALRRRHASYTGRRRAVTPPRDLARRGLLRTIGAVAAVGVAAGAVAVAEALPQRAAATTAAAAPHASPSPGPASDPASDPASEPASGPATGAATRAVGVVPAGAVAEPVATARTAAQLRVVRVSRSTERTRFGSCDGTAVKGHYANGRIPLQRLCRLTFAPGHRLRSDAAVALMRLDVDFRARFHRHLRLTDSYRSYPSQVSVAARKPGLAARPGTSEHGWGLAIDVAGGAEDPGSREHAWLLANAPAFGWDNPPWARPDGRRPEPWHWEYDGRRARRG